tara:strand:+ start:23228 stop:24964 length:1737 start_codon:yes stop_codon:yes gene_type:complete
MCSFWTGSSKTLGLQVDRNSVCSEPFESICSEEGNAKKILQVSNDWKALSYKNYMYGMERVLRETGHYSFKSFLTEQFEQNLVFITNFTDDEAKGLLRTAPEQDPVSSYILSKRDQKVATCESEINNLSDYFVDSEQKLKAFLKKTEYFQRPHQTSLSLFFKNNFSYFIQTAVLKCNIVRNHLKKNPNLDPRLKNLFEKAIEIDLCNSPTLSHKIILKYLNDEIQDADLEHMIQEAINLISIQISTDSLLANRNEFGIKAKLAKIQISDLCSTYQSSVQSRIDLIVSKTQEHYQISELGLTELMRSTFDKNSYDKMKWIFFAAKSGLLSFLKQNPVSEELSKKWTESIEQVHLWWPEMPSEESFSYSTEPGFEKIRIIDPLELTSTHPSFLAAQIGYSDQLNAFYTSVSGITPSEVHILPSIVYLSDSFPLSVFHVTAHELGHHLDPFVGETNGLSTLKAFKTLTSCYSKPDSFALKPPQSGETIADYLASESLVELYRNPKMAPLLPQAGTSMTMFCIFANERKNVITEQKAAHPEPFYRVDAIAFANPRFRELFGCNSKGTYRMCSLQPAQGEFGP